MVLLDGFTQLHLFHGLLDNEVYFYNEKSLAIKLHCQKAFTECAWEEDTRGLPNRIGSPRLNPQTFLRFSFTNTTDFRTQFRGIRAFYKRKGPAGEVGSSSYTKPSVFHSNFPECRLHSVWNKKLFACL